MQYNLMGEPSVLNKVNEVLVHSVQTIFFNLVLEDLADKRRLALGGEPPIGEDEDYDPEQERAERIENFVEGVLGDRPDDRTEEEHQSMLDSLTEDVTELFDSVTETFLNNPDNTDQLDILANQDLSIARDLTWTTGGNGGFVFIFK
ncbi:hypothetical protein [Vibrio phage phiKT1019]|nr:hypothetical protein [Vibrio phage phiKT1019]